MADNNHVASQQSYRRVRRQECSFLVAPDQNAPEWNPRLIVFSLFCAVVSIGTALVRHMGEEAHQLVRVTDLFMNHRVGLILLAGLEKIEVVTA